MVMCVVVHGTVQLATFQSTPPMPQRSGTEGT